MVSVTLLLPVSISDRSEKNTSCLMLSAARSPLIMSIIMAIDLARTIGSHAALRHRLQLVAMLSRERLPDRHEIVPRIQPFRNLADVFAKRFAVAQECRAREHVDLRAGIVDVIFARDVVAGKIKQAAQRVAEHRAPAVADMHRSGRIGRDVFDIDLGAVADRAFAVGRSLAQHGAQFARPDLRLQGEIDEAGTRRPRRRRPDRRRAIFPRSCRRDRAA